jgi:hypothetical protein
LTIAAEIDSENEGSPSSNVPDLSSDGKDSSVSPERPTRPTLRPVIRLSSANVSELTCPKSQYMGWRPPMEVSPEIEAVAHLMVSCLGYSKATRR